MAIKDLSGSNSLYINLYINKHILNSQTQQLFACQGEMEEGLCGQGHSSCKVREDQRGMKQGGGYCRSPQQQAGSLD